MVSPLWKIFQYGLLIISIYVFYGSAVPLIGVIKHVFQDTQSRKFEAALFTMVKT